ncbi:hypothetical protein [Methylorubrum extorquens]
MTSDQATLSREDRAFTEALCDASSKLRQAVEDVRALSEFLRGGDSARLTPRQEAVAKTHLGGFVTGLR